MEPLTVQCLRCGHARAFRPGRYRFDECGACPRCQYVGWAPTSELERRPRRLLRERPLGRRRRSRQL